MSSVRHESQSAVEAFDHARAGESRALETRVSKHLFRGIRSQNVTAPAERGLGPDSAGQSGDDQGLSEIADADSESVEELVEEGQAFEAEVIGGVEDAPDAGVAEVHTRQLPEDDVPPEYQGSDR